jgi:hypothetical protein
VTRRVAIVGSRVHPNLEVVRKYVRSLPEDTIVISGGAYGVDKAAASEARKCGLTVIEWMPLHFDNHHRPAIEHVEWADRLLWRNTMIAIDCTEMTVFPEGSKGGCWDAAREAKRFKRPVEIRDKGRVYEYMGGFAKKVKSTQEELFG